MAQAHPFIDGNKRTAFSVTYTFVTINGESLLAEADATYTFIIGLYDAGMFEFERLAKWLRCNVSFE